MDVSYSFTPLTGYKDSLVNQNVKLPLNYPTIDNHNPKKSTTPNNEFHKKIATTGKIINLPKQSIVPAVSISVYNDMKTIVLTPMEFQLSSIGFQFQNLIIDLPHSTISTNCITFYYHQDHILIDLIDQNYLFITLKIAVDRFILGGQQLTLDNFEEWGYISVPYSFELRSSPFLLKCLDNLNLIVSLKDGGLLHFKRDEELGEINVFNFQEQGTLIPFLGFFGSGKQKDVVLDGVSSNSIVDALQIGGSGVVITLSVNKVLKLWNLDGHQNLSSLTIASDDDTWLPTIPSKYLKSYDQEDGKTIITLFINTKSGDSSKSMFVFKSLELESSNLHDLSDLSFQPELPNSLLFSSDVFYHESNFQNTIWFIQDYEVVGFGTSQLKYYILWKSNTSSILVEYTINPVNGAILSIEISHPNGFEIDENISAYHDAEYYMDRIFDSGNYDSLIVLTSIKILSQHWEIDNDMVVTSQSSRQLAIDTINSKAESGTIKNYWFKLQSLCEEFKNLSQETLSLSVFDNQVLTLNVNGHGIFRKSAFFESFANQKLNSADGKLMLIFNKFETFISRKSYHKLHEELLQLRKISANDITNLFTKHIEGKISTNEIQTILKDLEQIPGIVEIVKSLIGSSGFELIVDANSISSKELGAFHKISTVMIFKNIMETHKTLLLDLVVLFLTCETNDQIVEFVNQIRATLVQYDVMEVVFTTCLNKGEVETKNMGQVQNSIFWSSVVATHSQLKRLIESLQLNDGYEYFYNNVLPDDYLVDVVIELINNKEYFFLQKKFLTKLNQENKVEKLLVGLIYLFNNDVKSFYKIFNDYSNFQNFTENKIKNLNQDVNLQKFIEALLSNPSKSQYFHGLSKLVQSQIKTNDNKSQQEEHCFIEIASDFETLAIENESDITIREEFYLNLFELSLPVSNYDITTKCLKNLTLSTNFKNLMTKFITKIIFQLKLDIIFPPNNNDDDFYGQHFSLIDSIIVKVAQDSNLSQSLRVYQYLYSWRLFGCMVAVVNNNKTLELGDKRGAIEALYEFITRFRIENPTGDVERKVKLKILEIYMIILNLLKSFENNQDQWFLKTNSYKETTTTRRRSIVSLNDLKLEYLEWLKNLDEDVSMFT